ncbi:lipopolysaccharide transport periplasmic protein LptA [Paracoccus methylarcula]|uniref:Lipopolysaccharide transport periplasmic protein LptA n=1 Tax=Paracoccus methylarcula TaxID=72022 RepID=A0A3R7LLP1_9RHOB|nr:lipopolysaccharide transport periplasmic protein LptA [Paracoccus methylarcula]RNF36036.1 lipopolysaccharide transport periplasmic protein LptA [Paracoccus methylarcula]
MPRLLIIALTLLAMPAMAQEIGFGGLQADVSAPVEVAADSLSVEQESGRAIFTGNVVIGQGEMRLSAREVTVEYADGGQSRIKSLHARGEVTLVSGEDAAEAAEATYDVESGHVTLIGDVVMTRGGNVLTGDRMQVDLATGTARVDGRVRSVFQPGEN